VPVAGVTVADAEASGLSGTCRYVPAPGVQPAYLYAQRWFYSREEAVRFSFGSYSEKPGSARLCRIVSRGTIVASHSAAFG